MRYLNVRTYVLLAIMMLAAGGCEITKQSVVDPGPTDPSDTTGNGDTTELVVNVSVSPSEAVVEVGRTEQFFATVTGTAHTAVTWSVESGEGTIDADGLYTAPASIGVDTLAVVIRAVSDADARAFGRVDVRVVKPAGVDTLNPGEICFEREVLPIFLSNCALSGCHDAISAQAGNVFTSYAGILREVRAGRPQNSPLYLVLVENDPNYRMPPPPYDQLPAQQIETIRTWIEQGAKDTRCSPGEECDTADVTYSAVVRPVLQTNCVSCHSGPNPPLGVNLTTYQGAKVVADDGRLYGVISHAPGFPPMPQGGQKLDDCTISRIKAWIDAGAANN